MEDYHDRRDYPGIMRQIDKLKDQMKDIRKLLTLVAKEVIGSFCEDCSMPEKDQVKCDGCSTAICKCSSYHDIDDYYKFCSMKCLEAHFTTVYIGRTGMQPSPEFQKQIFSKYEKIAKYEW